MSAESIKAKVANGLKKAIAATGSSTSPKVYVVKKTLVSGGGYPGDPYVYDYANVELVNAVTNSYDPKDVDGQNFLATDINVIASGYVEVNADDKLIIDGKDYEVKAPNPVRPAGVVLSYSIQAVLQ